MNLVISMILLLGTLTMAQIKDSEIKEQIENGKFSLAKQLIKEKIALCCVSRCAMVILKRLQ
mgnify:CR=1 FL=1